MHVFLILKGRLFENLIWKTNCLYLKHPNENDIDKWYFIFFVFHFRNLWIFSIGNYHQLRWNRYVGDIVRFRLKQYFTNPYAPAFIEFWILFHLHNFCFSHFGHRKSHFFSHKTFSFRCHYIFIILCMQQCSKGKYFFVFFAKTINSD
jgi:hypothetical protein